MKESTKRPAVFLDRDGTINRTRLVTGVPKPPTSIEDVEILPGVAEALARLRAVGLPLIVATNQPDVARGTLERESVERIHDWLADRLALDAIFVCYHDNSDHCACRKPRPGMLIDASERFHLDLPRSFMVGDRWQDIAAGRAAGCTTILLRQEYSGDEAQPDYDAVDLAAAAEIILRCAEERTREDLRRHG